MTDLPRKAYPLVVPPPGGFEDAVRRGRRRRRQRTGGSTGAALALVGVLAYAITGGGGSGTDQLDTARNPKVDGPAPGPIGGDPVRGTTARPSASPTATRPASGGRPVSGPAPGTGVTTVTPTVRPTVPASPPPTATPTLAYAARPTITRDDPSAYSDLSCATEQGQEWCTRARVDNQSNDEVYTLNFAVCRGVGAGDATLRFTRTPQVDFKAVEDATTDAVWTYSAGVRAQSVTEDVDVPAGNCVVWHTNWDGLDDFGRMPAAGWYTLHARVFAANHELPAETFQFEHY